MNEQDKNWLLTEFPKYKGLVPKGDVWGKYLEAERILLGRDKILERGCSCQRNSVTASVNSLYENWLNEQSKKI